MAVRGRAAAALVQRTLARRCPGLAPVRFEPSDGTDEYGATWLGAQPLGTTALILHKVTSGNGVYAEYDVDATRYDLVACTATTLRIDYADEALTGSVDEMPPLSLLRQVVGPAHDRGDPAHAYATLLATTTGACVPEDPPDFTDDAPQAGAPGLEVLPLPFGEQPWFPGPPRPQARVWREVQDGAQVIVPPKRLRRLRVVDGVEVFGADLPGRNGGLALALYDPRADRHRWLLFTRACLYGTSVYWLAEGSGLAVGYAASGHPVYWQEGRDGLFAIDLIHARAYRLLLDGAAMLWEPPGSPEGGDHSEPAVQPDARQIGRLRKDATVLRSRCGTEISLSSIRAAIDAGVATIP
ncbi:MAG TPA: hypothetical protein VGB85_10525 [Nannocystis sp.]